MSISSPAYLPSNSISQHNNCTSSISQGLKRNLLRLVHTRPLNPLQLLHKLGLQRFVIRLGPRPVFLERLGDADLEVQTAAANLARHLGARKCL
mmetsp:Transcript_19643/g.36776  ORF Transcript_19643/g.36776 Transcript_19643/m.36776 type:complete len:94 (-) Transcript_19643:427-708(-)